jgi:hypothetical protein
MCTIFPSQHKDIKYKIKRVYKSATVDESRMSLLEEPSGIPA